ncbi:MAG: FG-GAP-like repeat-containing protein, partial [Akkermansiaceae bacterium]
MAKELPPTSVGFKKIQLFDKYITEGASIGDVNADGKPDVVAGPLWWQGPDLKQSFAYAPVKIYPTTGPGLSGYSNNFFTFPDKITKDKWTDILKVGLPAQPAHLAINPGEKPFPHDNAQHSCTHCKAQDHICNESPQYVNVLGKGKQLLAYSRNHITLSEPDSDPTKPWKVYNVSHKDGGLQMYTHGLGAGDINGDNLPDILEKRGWWQQPKNWDRKTPWKFHPYPFAPKQGGAQMFSYDIDGDGDSDVVTALNAHSWGLAWYEQIKENGKITFKKHTVMTDKPTGNPYGVCFSQPHAMACTDIDGDGIKDIVTGKCYFAHNGRDPGAHQPAVLYWFRTVRSKNGTELVPYQIDDNSGVGRQITTGDINGDGKIDIVVGNKKGVFAFIQTKIDPKSVRKKKLQPKALFLEGEALEISKRSGNLRPQPMHTYGAGKWSNNSHLWWTGSKPNDQIELSFHVPATGSYRIGVGMTKARDYGMVEFYLDGKKISGNIDLYNDGVIHTGTIPLGGKHTIKSGNHRLGVKITGANPKAIKSYMFALDYLIIHPGDKAELQKHRPKPVAKVKKKFTEGMGNTLEAKAQTMQQQLAGFTVPEGFVIENVSHEGLGTIKPISL